ncbi:hypothetical protein [Mycobacterium sp. URHB0044]|uniref:hypothetical protein n=1 Tax=Mycobacterium sp. URHB0044 TaxID=1380386 RepID=UPI00048A7F22|nr:hypothetical protein [Mycobacterium sp. URHB0044]
MTTASILDVGDRGITDAVTDHAPHGVVCVHNLRFAHSTAACTCGWAGRRRYLKAAAEQDAWEHAMHDRCSPACPLVIGW